MLARILKLVGSCIGIAGVDEFRAFIILEKKFLQRHLVEHRGLSYCDVNHRCALLLQK